MSSTSSERQMNGVLGTKVGMTQVFDDANRIVPVTVVKAGPCVVTQVRTPSTDGYNAVQLAFGAVDPRKVNKPRPGTSPRPASRRVATSSSSAPPTPRSYDRPGGHRRGVRRRRRRRRLGTTKGKGTAGVMKRHGFHGLGACHGTQRKHRSPGSIGGCATPGRVFKGMRMAGRMGDVQANDAEPDRARRRRRARACCSSAAPSPAPSGGLVLVRSAVKRHRKGA